VLGLLADNYWAGSQATQAQSRVPYRPFFLEHEEENEAYVAAGVERASAQPRVQPERALVP
jgi:hypothetical protein